MEKNPSLSSSSPLPKPKTKSLPYDVIYDILAKLPVKSLMRFLCISKVCASFITTPSFAKIHALHFPFKPEALLISCPARLQSAQNFYSVDFNGGSVVHLMSIPPRFSRYTTHSVNGLILMDFGLYATICNPSTRQTLDLPFISSPTSPSANSTYFCVNSFGFDPVSEVYKVLNTWASPGRDTEYRIFQLGTTKSWRVINGGSNYYPERESVWINGILYFRSWISAENLREKVLIAFDLHEESFRAIKIPENALRHGNETKLIVYSGRPAIANHLLIEDDSISIWVLDESQRDSWIKITVFIFENVLSEEFLDEDIDYFVDGNGHTNELLLVPQVFDDFVYVIFYDVLNCSMRRVEIAGLPENRPWDLSSNTIMVTDYEENIMPLTFQ